MCAYCGTEAWRLEREHIIPRCLYPESRACSRVQRITVPSRGPCNRGWADDEAHFRNVLLVAGESNVAVQEIWEATTRRSYRKADGRRRLQDLVDRMVPVQVEGLKRWMIYPARDERVLRVLRKIVRGLSHFHGVGSAVPEERVWVNVHRVRESHCGFRSWANNRIKLTKPAMASYRVQPLSPSNTPSPVVNMPATHAVIRVANVAARRARHPRLASSSRRDGINTAIPPTKTATDATCANPLRA
jgi:hypothetical protein